MLRGGKGWGLSASQRRDLSPRKGLMQLWTACQSNLQAGSLRGQQGAGPHLDWYCLGMHTLVLDLNLKILSGSQDGLKDTTPLFFVPFLSVEKKSFPLLTIVSV